MKELSLFLICFVPSLAGSLLAIKGRRLFASSLGDIGFSLEGMESMASPWTLLCRFPWTPTLSGAVGGAAVIGLSGGHLFLGQPPLGALLSAAMAMGAAALCAGIGIFLVMSGAAREPESWMREPGFFNSLATFPTIVIPAGLAFCLFSLTTVNETWARMPWTSLPPVRALAILLGGLTVYVFLLWIIMGTRVRWSSRKRYFAAGIADFALLAPAFYSLLVIIRDFTPPA